MLIFDFFAGTGSSTQAFADAGHTVITFELDPDFDVTETVDITNYYKQSKNREGTNEQQNRMD